MLVHLHFMYCKQSLKQYVDAFWAGQHQVTSHQRPLPFKTFIVLHVKLTKWKGPNHPNSSKTSFCLNHVLTIMVFFISFHVDVIWRFVQVVDVSLSRQRLQRSPCWTTHLQEGLSCWARKLTTPGMDEKKDMQQVPWCFGCSLESGI